MTAPATDHDDLPLIGESGHFERCLVEAHNWLDEISDVLRARRTATGDPDADQQIAYDLAVTVSELEAARALDETAGGDSQLIQRLSSYAVARILSDVRHRLGPRAEELRVGAGRLDEIAAPVRGWLHAGPEQALGGELLTNDPHFDDEHLDGAHRLLRESYRRFANEKVAPEAESIHREDRLVPEPLLQGLAELGCFGLSIPQSYGGLLDEHRPDTLSMLLATEELSRASLGAAGSLITRPEVVGRAILAGGSEEQKQRWLPRLASGEVLCAVAVTEPDHGSDVASMQLRARTDGDGYRLQGSKMWCTFAGRAELLMVLARTDASADAGHRGLSLFLVEKPAFEGHDFELHQQQGGALRGRAIATLGYRGMHSYEVFFDDWWVPAEALAGGEAGVGRGFYMTMAGFAGGRIQTAARAVGVMQAAWEEAVSYARQRHTFGRPIGDYPLIRARLADCAGRLHASRRLTYAAARRMDTGIGDLAAAMVKLYASRAAEKVTREAVQIHGGVGYAEETPVSRYFVDARVLPIFEGTEEILALKVIARSLLD
jgi:(2S)-methylsuccinyl-CoA dehydrogenase